MSEAFLGIGNLSESPRVLSGRGMPGWIVREPAWPEKPLDSSAGKPFVQSVYKNNIQTSYTSHELTQINLDRHIITPVK